MVGAVDALCKKEPYAGKWLEEVGNINWIDDWRKIEEQEHCINKIVFNPELKGYRTLTFTDKTGRGYYCSVERPDYEEVKKLIEKIQQLNVEGVK